MLAVTWEWFNSCICFIFLLLLTVFCPFFRFLSGYIDLSKRRVSPEEAIKCEDKFTKSKTVSGVVVVVVGQSCKNTGCRNLTIVRFELSWCKPPCLQVYSILRHVAEVLEYSKDEQLENLYQRTAWVFDEKYKRPGYGAYDVFKLAVSWVFFILLKTSAHLIGAYHQRQCDVMHVLSSRDPSILDGLDLTEEERNVLIDNINRRLTPQAVKIRAGTWEWPSPGATVAVVSASLLSWSHLSLLRLQTLKWRATATRVLMRWRRPWGPDWAVPQRPCPSR